MLSARWPGRDNRPGCRLARRRHRAGRGVDAERSVGIDDVGAGQKRQLGVLRAGGSEVGGAGNASAAVGSEGVHLRLCALKGHLRCPPEKAS